MSTPVFQTKLYLFLNLAAFCLAIGCRPPSNSPQAGFDPIAAAIHEAEEAGEKRCLEASRPILMALQNRDYAALYEHLSPHALRYFSPEQFMPNSNSEMPSAKPNDSAQLMSLETFLEAMKSMESQLGVPMKLDFLYVQTIDPDELAGKGDGLSNAFNIGAMSKEIPLDIRRGSIRAQVKCQPSDELAQEIAEEFKLPVADVKAGKIPESSEFDPDTLPYLTFKYVLVEEANQLKIGYFEFLPPSILD